MAKLNDHPLDHRKTIDIGGIEPFTLFRPYDSLLKQISPCVFGNTIKEIWLVYLEKLIWFAISFSWISLMAIKSMSIEQAPELIENMVSGLQEQFFLG
ncbi:MAG: hypothetical protein WCI64_06465 [Chlorobium sp.]